MAGSFVFSSNYRQRGLKLAHSEGSMSGMADCQGNAQFKQGAAATTAGVENGAAATTPVDRKDPYEVLGLSRDATDAQIKSAYRKMALRFHPDKNVNNPEAAEQFKELVYSYNILINPEKRKQYDTAGFEGVDLEGLNMELDLTSLGTVSTVLAAFFSKLGVPFKTSISLNVLEDALNGTVTVRPLALGRPVQDKVEKQQAHFYGVSITQSQAEHGVVIRVTSAAQSRFKLLYFEQEDDGALGLLLQEDSAKTGKITSAGMYFLHFQVHQLDATANALAMAKNPDAAFFKRLQGLKPCDISEIQEGTHIFAVYGDNFFKSASYTIEAVCAQGFEENVQEFKKVELQLLAKQNELLQFETEYQEALARFNAVTNRYAQEKQMVKDLLKRRDKIHESFSSNAKSDMSSQAVSDDKKQCRNGESVEDSGSKEEPQPEVKEKPNKKKWFGFKVEKN